MTESTLYPPGHTAVLFAGQGSERLDMGRRLYETSRIFASALDAVTGELDRHLGRSLRAVMWGTDDAVLRTSAWAQPAVFAVDVALYRLLRWSGLAPDYLLGHSVGEVAAAHVAGVFSLSDACRLVVARARLTAALSSGGAMTAVHLLRWPALPPADPGGRLLPAHFERTVAVAAIDAPGSFVVAGAESAVAAVDDYFAARGHRTRRLPVSHPIGSVSAGARFELFEAVLRTLTYHPAAVPVVSNVTGKPAADRELRTAAYWMRQCLETVRFADGLQWLDDHGVTTFVEVGPGATLTELAELNDVIDSAVVAVLREGADERVTALRALAHLSARGLAAHAAIEPLGPSR